MSQGFRHNLTFNQLYVSVHVLFNKSNAVIWWKQLDQVCFATVVHMPQCVVGSPPQPVPPPASQRWCNDVNATVVLPPVPCRRVISGLTTQARWLSVGVGSTAVPPPLVPPPASQRWCNDVHATVVLPPVPRRCVISGPTTQARWLSAGVGSTAVPPPLVPPPASQRWRNDVCPTGGLPPARRRCVHGHVTTVGAATVVPPEHSCRLASATAATTLPPPATVAPPLPG